MIVICRFFFILENQASKACKDITRFTTRKLRFLGVDDLFRTTRKKPHACGFSASCLDLIGSVKNLGHRKDWSSELCSTERMEVNDTDLFSRLDENREEPACISQEESNDWIIDIGNWRFCSSLCYLLKTTLF